ncbi:MAG: AIPR family protein [Methylophilaceae bacterium]|nr:AIPR family protein [Methylophilaceae bacterium]
MYISLEEFHHDFIQTIISDAESRGLLRPQAFYENVCEALLGSAELTNNYTVAEYNKVCGYDYDEERQILTILGHSFFQNDDELQALLLSDINSGFNKLKSFLKNCNTPSFYKQLEESSPAYAMAHDITQILVANKIKKIRLMLLTDARTTKNLSQLDLEILLGLEIEFRVVDINYLYKLYLSEQVGGDYETEVNLQCLKIVSNDTYQSYLAVIYGPDLVKIYDKYGQKLFEQNVRTFLQFRGGVNKGLRNTIQYSPEMFFAYNNGLTATATDIEFSENGNINKITNLQIVNGGQTTSAIYAAHKISKLDVSNIAVQIKLSVVEDIDKTHDFISKVSQYANTQNKINPSDFFSNSPFHKEFKDYSKRIRVSAVGGSQLQTHWFYERVRGEYLNEQAYLTPAKKRQFLLENPKSQLLEKTLLAKAEVSWLQKPDNVSKGSQDSTKIFAEEISGMLEKNSLAITELYFKNAVAKMILFKFIEKLISKAPWYNQAYRAQAVTYTMAYLAFLVKSTGKAFNFKVIWDNQTVPDYLEKILNVIAEQIYSYITTPKEGYGNPSQWCKRETCWKEVKNLTIDVSIDQRLLIDDQENLYVEKSAKSQKLLDSGIEIQTFVISQKSTVWKELFTYLKSDSVLSQMQLDILSKYANGNLKLPSEKQSKIIYELYIKAINEGLIFSG